MADLAEVRFWTLAEGTFANPFAVVPLPLFAAAGNQTTTAFMGVASIHASTILVQCHQARKGVPLTVLATDAT